MKNKGCWSKAKERDDGQLISNITTPEDCHQLCRNGVSCKSFVFGSSDQKCWLKNDESFIPENDITVVGPKQCPRRKFFNNMNTQLIKILRCTVSHHSKSDYFFSDLGDLNANDDACRHACEYLHFQLEYKPEKGKFSKTTYKHFEGRFISNSQQGNICLRMSMNKF